MIELLTDVSLVTLDLDEESSFSPVAVLQGNDGIVESWQIASMLYTIRPPLGTKKKRNENELNPI